MLSHWGRVVFELSFLFWGSLCGILLALYILYHMNTQIVPVNILLSLKPNSKTNLSVAFFWYSQAGNKLLLSVYITLSVSLL